MLTSNTGITEELDAPLFVQLAVGLLSGLGAGKADEIVRSAPEVGLRRALEEDRNRLEAADVAKNEFLSSLSHELRTPLVAIIGYASMLIRHLSGSVNDVEMERLRTIERNGKRLSAQIEDLLDLSRIQTRRLEISQKWIEWRLFLKDVGQSMEPLLSATGHHLNLDIEHGDTWVFVDSTRIHQVVSNLIGNAAKYSPGASRVDVVSRVKSGEIVFSVRDYGAGIKPEDQKNLFTLFYRTEDAIKSAVPGTGIGLYVSKKIVELHKGDLNIDSIYGEGTTATLRLTSTATEPPVSALSAPAFRNRFEEQSA
ncbi:MAG: HAMP domain-containing sensor histidine kinase [Chloroflexi bacterium]|nr:HAMP domain-containing sensor histidine kinase [Chloroflexota bacterium]